MVSMYYLVAKYKNIAVAAEKLVIICQRAASSPKNVAQKEYSPKRI